MPKQKNRFHSINVEPLCVSKESDKYLNFNISPTHNIISLVDSKKEEGEKVEEKEAEQKQKVTGTIILSLKTLLATILQNGCNDHHHPTCQRHRQSITKQ